MSKNEIVVYWSPKTSPSIDEYDWNFLYPKPKTLFNSIKEHTLKNENDIGMVGSSSILACPAISNKFKKIAVFNNPISCSYFYDFSNFEKDNSFTIEQKTKQYISLSVSRSPVLDYGPSIQFSLGYMLFSEEPLETYFTPPMFHKPKYTKYGSVIPGEFDIGQWFRPFNFEVQMWNKNGEFHLEEGEPLFYVEFKTNKKVIMKRFNMTDNLKKSAQACVDSSSIFGKGQSLKEKYKKFSNTNMRDNILDEIKSNIVFESKPIEI